MLLLFYGADYETRSARFRARRHARGRRNSPRLFLCFATAFSSLAILINAKKKHRSASSFSWSGLRDSNSLPPPWQGGALPDELNPHLWCFRTESNHRHGDFQSPALPTELQKHIMATRNGLEPSTSCVTGRRSNQLNYRAKMVGVTGLEPVTLCL